MGGALQQNHMASPLSRDSFFFVPEIILWRLAPMQHARLNLRMRDMWLLCQQEGCVEIKLIFPQLKMS